jgi:hypothetical protein
MVSAQNNDSTVKLKRNHIYFARHLYRMISLHPMNRSTSASRHLSIESELRDLNPSSDGGEPADEAPSSDDFPSSDESFDTGTLPTKHRI